MAAEVVILGGGVGGTLTANLVARQAGAQAHVTVVDTTGQHVYQPGFLYVALGKELPKRLSHAESSLLRSDVDLVTEPAVKVDPTARTVELASGRTLAYDQLVLATGSRTTMDEVPGGDAAYDFYTMIGATRLWL
ncbi:MAG TPA: FAD-dependent oxidoreductase, partial [Pedococcus sp.]|nr:FAD-dependent oxidoreductase [Pedococcus sp.]